MRIEVRRKHDGTLKSRYFYGSFTVNGKRHVKSLGLEIKGAAPASLHDVGDTKFEVSRAKAEERLRKHIEDARSSRSAESLVQDVHAIKYGSKIEAFPVKDLIEAWEAMPKKRRELNERYVKNVKRTIERFITYIEKRYPQVEDAQQVDRKIALDFMHAEEKRGVTDKTWNDTLKRLRATFRFLQHQHGLSRNPFEGIKLREEIHRHRRPLSEAQIKKLLEVSADDHFCRPLIICGLTTAMRLGDCCKLEWSSVDLDSKSPAVVVKTSKTGETVCIPTFEHLRNELDAARNRNNGNEKYVWPEQAKLYLRQHSQCHASLERFSRRQLEKTCCMRRANRASSKPR